MTEWRLFLRHSQVLALVLAVAVFCPLLAAAKAGDPQTSPRRPADASDSTPQHGDPDQASEQPPEYDNRQFRSGPPDTTPYSRPVVPEDYEPQGKPAIPSNIEVPPPNDPDREQESGDKDGGGIPFQ